MAADDAEPVLLGYSMGGRLALEALVEDCSAWAAAMIVSAQPGLADPVEREARLVSDGGWAGMLEKGEQGWANFQTAWDLQPVLAGSVRPSGDREWREGLEAGFGGGRVMAGERHAGGWGAAEAKEVAFWCWCWGR